MLHKLYRGKFVNIIIRSHFVIVAISFIVLIARFSVILKHVWLKILHEFAY